MIRAAAALVGVALAVGACSTREVLAPAVVCPPQKELSAELQKRAAAELRAWGAWRGTRLTDAQLAGARAALGDASWARLELLHKESPAVVELVIELGAVRKRLRAMGCSPSPVATIVRVTK